MADAAGIKARILADACAILELIDGHVIEPVKVVIVSGDDTTVTISSPLANLPPALRTYLRQNKLSAIDKAILATATHAPLTAKRLASMSGYTAGSHFSAALTRLVRRGLLEHSADGYRLANPSRTPEETRQQ